MHLLKHVSRKSLSDIIITYDDGREVCGEMLHCVHCGFMWQVKPGSGKKRGFCQKCSGPTCGRTDCDTCIPLMKKLGY